MEDKLKHRRLTRCYFSNEVTELEGLLASNAPIAEVTACLQSLQLANDNLRVVDADIYELMLGDKSITEDAIVKDLKENSKYNKKYLLIASKVDALKMNGSNAKGDSESTSSGVRRRRYKLPTIQFKHFDGTIKDWLPFWSQFVKIHEDCEMDAADKFEYLHQATAINSSARTLVDSYPAIAGNYEKVIKALKSRFGRTELQIEVYIRELLKIIVRNSSAKNKPVVSELHDQLATHLRTLDSLGVTAVKCGAILYPLIESCLPEDLIRVWQRSSYARVEESEDEGDPGDMLGQRLLNIMSFLKQEVLNEQRFLISTEGLGFPKQKLAKPEPEVLNSVCKIPTAAGLVSHDASCSSCIFCGKKSHRSSKCYQLSALSAEKRRQLVADKGACFRCLRMGHHAKNCKSSLRCYVCQGEHMALFCTSKAARRGDRREEEAEKVEEAKVAKRTVTSTNSSNSHVFMQTLRVTLVGEKACESVRVLIDTGSQYSYILQSTAEKLGYHSQESERILHTLFGGSTVLNDHNRYEICAEHDGYRCKFHALSQVNICNEISPVFFGPWVNELKQMNIDVADFGESGPIQVLIGSDVAGRLYTGRRHVLPCGIVAIETLLGWTIMGKVPPSERASTMCAVSMLTKDVSLERLWELEALGIADPGEKKSQDELAIEAKRAFVESTTVNEEGRYEVCLPWLQYHPVLPDNYLLAQKRLANTVKKLQSSGMMAEYNSIFQDWLHDDVIELVSDGAKKRVGHYLPHRPVIKESSLTTRVRPVFDASAREGKAPSLNQCLEKGANLITLIPNILLGFRMCKYGVISDVRKAFLQISIQVDDRDVLRFLWLDADGNEIVYRHRRVVFGLTCSPYLLGETIEQHLQRAREKVLAGTSEPRISLVNVDKLRSSFYVDNSVTSVTDVDSLRSYIAESNMIMWEAKFDLRGWEHSFESCEADADATTGVLGFRWNKTRDTLCINLDNIQAVNIPSGQRVTKRLLLSVAQRVFDPIGFTTPTTVIPKLLVQRAWRIKSSWDALVEEDIDKDFRRWMRRVKHLDEIEIPRWCCVDVMDAGATLHIFCDASKDAYSAVVFLRGSVHGVPFLRLLSAKSRVSPVKQLTIPRLELMAAVIGTRLCKSIKDGLKVILKEYFWSDSTTVLAWIKRDEPWSVFVSNRVAEIRKATACANWRHVPGSANPADLPSRGVFADELVASKWWEGPTWLLAEESSWPSLYVDEDSGAVQVELKKSCCMVNIQKCDFHLRYFSKYEKIIRMMAWILRFVYNLKHAARRRGELNTEEVVAAEKHVLRAVQQEEFSGEGVKRLATLSSFVDEDGLIRLKTRISQRDDFDAFRYPIVLPSKHPVVDKLVYDEHRRSSHVRTQGLISLLREKFWILGGKNYVKSVIGKCVICKRYAGKKFTTEEAALPENRVKSAAAFEVTGIDYAGPLILRGGQKSWVCFFTCAVYRAIHVELCTALSTENFLKALRRFIARRGRPAIIYTDNGTNFVGASNAFGTLDWDTITRETSIERIIWRFNPPSAPWWGGFWERLIGSLKQLLRKVLGRASLCYEDLVTVLCDCESVINNRPITHISSDPSELAVLTPAMFLREQHQDGVPDCDNIDSSSMSRKVVYLKRLREELRHRFRNEYLGQLAVLHKRRCSRPVRLDDVVLVESDNQKRAAWPLGRVVELFPAKDGQVRLVKVGTANGRYLRPVQRLVPLECGDDQSNEHFIDASREISKEPVDIEFKKVVVQDTKEEDIVVTRSGRCIKTPSRFKDV